MRQVSTNLLTKATISTRTITRIVTASSTLQKVSASSPVKKPVTTSSIIEIIPTSNEDGKTTGYPPTKTGNIMYILFCCSGVISRTRTDAFISRAQVRRARAERHRKKNEPQYLYFGCHVNVNATYVRWFLSTQICKLSRSLFQFKTQKITPNNL